VRELAETMVKLAHEYPEYAAAAKKVRIVKTTADRYYGRGYQDVQNRVPKIENTMRELRWRPRVGMKEALRRIYDAYRTDVAEARHLVK
jgi:nucleoside-diphosphate-sugar epimerase